MRLVVGVTLALLVGILVWGFSGRRPEIDVARPDGARAKADAAPTDRVGASASPKRPPIYSPENRDQLIADIRRRSKVGVLHTDSNLGNLPEGTVQLTSATNEEVAGVIDAFHSGTHPERLTPTVMPAPFDQAAYQQDPEAYLRVVEPGRVWQSAQPGPGTRRLRALSPKSVQMRQGEAVRLRVLAEPGGPVTFTSFDLGVFSNQLVSQTVQASDEGVAEATFSAPTGTLFDVHIVAASPLSSGRVEFLVHVLERE